jgi:hypothetical protein
MNLRQLKEAVDLLLEQFEKKEILDTKVQVLIQADDDLLEASDEAFRIIETEEGETIVAIDVSNIFEFIEEDDDDDNDDKEPWNK